MKKTSFVINEYYHIFNRGVDKRIIFSEKADVERFLQSMEEFNSVEPIGSIYENSFKKDKSDQLGSRTPKLVEFIAYCLNPNHFHLMISPLTEKGVQKFMQKLGTGYTNYFNEKNRRSGSLFQGAYKAVHINSNKQLLHVSAYVNLNDKVHQLKGPSAKLVRSSWKSYLGKSDGGICNKEIVLGQFKNINEYKDFALSSLKSMLESKSILKEF